MFAFAKILWDSVVFSGPLLNMTNDNVQSHDIIQLLAVEVVSSKRLSLINGKLSGEDLV